MSSTYTVRVGETMRDVVLNSTGSLANNTDTLENWDLICQANGFTDWTPLLTAGQVLIIPDTVTVDNNTLAQAQVYPFNNSTISGYLAVLQTVWDLLTDRWILRTGFWDDTGIWIDTENWID